ncbi:leucine Rich repeat-containing domain protein [Necator americanus]|uniref:Leucine Rich repeat-containing domain protein n=1 Tax=Necator americanus TaxID=51031 RepID=W2THN2_NECAM|nr:leucine Rich repeat-containing domain protein [Necator americanus]ETN80527.1 leucine Rich repeat-containing domain protein [Necator americanus]
MPAACHPPLEVNTFENNKQLFFLWELEIHSIVDDLSVRLGGVGEEWLTNSESSPKYFEFTPIEMHAITKRLRLPEPTAPDPRMVADLGNTIDFLHRVRALKVRGAKGYVGTSNIVWNSLSYSLHFCKSLLALWISDSDVSRVCGLGSVRRTLRRLVIHYSMNNLRDLLLEDEPLLPVTELEPWACLEEADFSFNELKSIDESVRVLGGVQKLNFSHNNVTDIGPYLQHLTCLTELDLSSNGISSVQQWNEVLGNVKKIILANNAIKDVTGLSRLYSLEFLDLRNNAIDTVPSVYPLGGLPCLEVLHLRGNPVRKVVEYRTRVLEAFAERSWEVKLDGRAPDDREKDTIRLRLALRRAKEEKEEKERKRREKIEEKIRYISGDVCAFSDEVESS